MKNCARQIVTELPYWSVKTLLEHQCECVASDRGPFGPVPHLIFTAASYFKFRGVIEPCVVCSHINDCSEHLSILFHVWKPNNLWQRLF